MKIIRTNPREKNANVPNPSWPLQELRMCEDTLPRKKTDNAARSATGCARDRTTPPPTTTCGRQCSARHDYNAPGSRGP
eukprot:2804522-Rhodomonas_salina.1